MNVFVGPGIKLEGQEEFSSKDAPFAWRLSLALSKLGVAIAAFKPAEMRTRITTDGFIQLVAMTDSPEEMALLIKEKCGEHVQFGELQLPIGLSCIGFEKAQNVWARRLIDYNVGNDSFIQRWDVLVRAK